MKAAILDLDGVITRTADVHARAWKRMFDAFLDARAPAVGEDHSPFDAVSEYRQHVDGKPRPDGVRGFLASRGIHLPEGRDDDGTEAETVWGLGNRKNAFFQELVRSEGVQVYETTIEQVERWRRQGLKLGVISSSRNCRPILESAGLLQRFDIIVDGNDLDRLGIPGKPAPDVFQHAARELGVEPAEAIVVEDAIAGVQAGRRGGFGEVVGLARAGDGDELLRAGADRVLSDLRDWAGHGEARSGPVPLMEEPERLAEALGNRQVALFLDYDGTLTPIVRRPEDATLSASMRALLERLARSCTVAIVSGRDRLDVEKMVGIDGLVYAGSHGFDIHGPDGLEMQHEEAEKAAPELRAAADELEGAVAAWAGARVERKRFALAVHYRELEVETDAANVRRAVESVVARHPSLRMKGGKKIFELQPDVGWDKGCAVLWLRQALEIDPGKTVTIYLGDDVTDEDAFRALEREGAGLGVLVGDPGDRLTSARYTLQDCPAVERFFFLLLERNDQHEPTP